MKSSKDTIFVLTRKDVIECARELDGRWWKDVVRDAINYTLKS